MGSYGNNATVSFPGENWQMLWPEKFEDFQLDIVGFLAILGEASILANAQVSALSRLFYLPRLIPAPQALLRVSRPLTLPPVQAHVTAVTTGNKVQHIHHVANVLLGTNDKELPKYSVRCVHVTKRTPDDQRQPQAPTIFDRFFRGQPKQAKAYDEKGQPEPLPPTVRAKAAGPLTWVTLLGFSLTLAIIIISIIYGDGMSLMAAIALSTLSTVVGVCNKWELRLPERSRQDVPDGTTVVRYPHGGFLVVRCDDVVARELFFAPEEISYTIKNLTVYRMLALLGSLMLMVGVILLANARLELQIAWAASYLILNAAHWVAAALPAKMHWDLSCYKVQEESIEGGPFNKWFTQALWKAILVTKSIDWVQLGEAAPRTETWNEWLRRALKHAKYAKSEEGSLIEPLPEWSARSNPKGIVHLFPKPAFDPKAVYDEIHQRAVSSEQSDAEEGELGQPKQDSEVTVGACDNPV